MDTLEGAALHDSSELGSFELVHYVDVLRTHNHIDRHILTEALVHALEIMSDEGNLPVRDHRTVEDVALPDKVGDKRVLRLVVDVHWGTDLLDPALGHHYDTVGKGQGFLLVMGNVDESDSELAMHFLQFDLHVLPHLQVESGKRLVKKKHLRIVHKGSGYGDTLLLSSGKRLDIAVFIVGHAHELQHLPHSPVDFFGIHSLQFQAECDVVIDIQMREKGISLKDGVQRSEMRRERRNVLAVHYDPAFIGCIESGYGTESRGLSASGRSEEGDEFSPSDVKVDVIKDFLP